MNELFNKISSYNILNNLLPGVLYVVLMNYFTEYSISHDNLLIGVVLYYFIGLTISRISSLITEPLLKKCRLIEFREYKLYLNACKKDSKIDVLVETSNKFRVLLTMIVLVIITKFYQTVNIYFFNTPESIEQYLLLIILVLIYMFSYRKQTSYINKRIDVNN